LRENMNFIPVPLQAVRGDLRRPHEHPASDSVILLEMGALIVLGEWDEWSQTQLARRFKCGKTRLLKCAQKLADQFQTMSGPATDQWRTAILEKFPQLTDTPGPEADQKRTNSGPRARSSLKREEKEEENAADAADDEAGSSPSDKAKQTKSYTEEFQRLATLRSSILNGQGALTEAAKTTKPAKAILDQYRKLRDRGLTEDGIAWLIRWTFLAPDDDKPGSAHYLRSKGYTSMKNLLVDAKADDRIERARRWDAAGCTLAGPHVANVDEGVLKRKATRKGPQARPDEIPVDDMVAVVLDIARQLRDGTRPLFVTWPRWLDRLDDRRVRLARRVEQEADAVKNINDESGARVLLEGAA